MLLFPREMGTLNDLTKVILQHNDGAELLALVSATMPVRVLPMLCSSPHGATCKYIATAAGKDGANAEAHTCGQVGVARDGQPGGEPQSARLLKD